MGYLPMSRSAFKVKDKIYKILQLIVPVTFWLEDNTSLSAVCFTSAGVPVYFVP